MKYCWLLFAVLVAPSVSRAETIPSPFQVGQTVRVFHPSKPRNWRGAETRALVTTIWYPTDSGRGAEMQEIGPPGHPHYIGHALVPHASFAPGRLPVILLSHGTGGSAASLDWFASALAERGYVVAGVNHPGNNALEPLTEAGFRLWWERASDISEVLDGVLADPQIGPHIDAKRIGAAGFSLGGYTVVELAGARTDVLRFNRFCESAAADAVCHPPEADALRPRLGRKISGHRLNDSDPATERSLARSGASYRDPRIRAVFAIAPALGEAFDPAGFAEIRIPVTITAGDGDVTVPIATNARRFANLIPQATLAILPGGVSHYTFLDQCVPELVEEQPQICRDADGVDRKVVHHQTAERAVSFFTKTLIDTLPR